MDSTVSTTTRRLVGFHRHTGQWVTLGDLKPADKNEDILRSVVQGGQPLRSAGVSVFTHADFSAFKIEEVVEVRWAEGGAVVTPARLPPIGSGNGSSIRPILTQ